MILWLSFSLSSPILDSTTIETLLICTYEKFVDYEMSWQSITMKCNEDWLRKGQQQCYGNVVLILILIKSHRPGETHTEPKPCPATWGEKDEGKDKMGPGGIFGPQGPFWPLFGSHKQLLAWGSFALTVGSWPGVCLETKKINESRVCCSLTIKFKFGHGWSVMVTWQGRGNLFHHQSAMKWVIKESLYRLMWCSDTPYQSFIRRHIEISLSIQTVKNYGDCRNWELCIPAAFWDPKILTAGSLSRPRYNNDRKWTLSSTFFPF